MTLPLFAGLACTAAQTAPASPTAPAAPSAAPFGHDPNDEESMFFAASRKVANFSALLNGGSYDRIWVDTDDLLREHLTKDQFVASLTQIHAMLGASTSRTLVAFRFDDRKGVEGAILTMRYDTTFTSGKAPELFVWRVTASNLVQLVDYQAGEIVRNPTLKG
jgi:hypothetical protein